MNITKQIKAKIHKLPAAKAFTTASLRHLGAADTVRKVLGRLVKEGYIERLARGVFAKPKQSSVAKIIPSARETVEAIAKSKGETLAMHGAEAARRLQLTTQIPLQLVLYTSGKSRQIKLRNRTVTLQHISPRKLIAPNTTTGMVISALWYLGSKQVSIATLKAIENVLTEKEFKDVLMHVEHMPAWMADNFYQYNLGKQKAA